MSELSLDLLPPELLRQIIEFSVPFTYHSHTYKSRQDTLRSLSFTSRNFRTLAQSLLCEIIYVKSKKSLDSTMDLLESRGSGIAVRQAIVKCSFDDEFDEETIERVCRVFPNLTTLTLDVWPLQPLDLSYLNRLPYLKDLRLSSECFAMVEKRPLPNLRFLTIYNVNIQDAKTLLDPTLLPSLQALALPGITEPEDWHPILKSEPFLALLPQLDQLVIDDDTMRLPYDLLKQLLPHSLVDCFIDAFPENLTPLVTARHLRLCNARWPSNSLESSMMIEASHRLADSIEEEKQVEVRSIYLDKSFKDTAQLPQDMALAVRKLVRASRTRDIEIVWKELPVDRGHDPIISIEFWARRREEKLGKK